MMTMMKIGKVAKATGLSVEAVRYYEREGLITEPTRSASGYRLYAPEVIKRLKFITRAKTLGFTLKEIGELLDLQVTPSAGCADVMARAKGKVAEIEMRIEQLHVVKRALEALITQCHGEGPLSHCTILDALENEDE